MNNRVRTGYWFEYYAYVCGITGIMRDPLGFILFYLSGENVNFNILDIHSVWSLLVLIEQIDMHNLALMMAGLEELKGVLGCTAE